MTTVVPELVHRYTRIWQSLPAGPIAPGVRYGRLQQRCNERATNRFVEDLAAALEACPEAEDECTAWKHEVVQLSRHYLFDQLCLPRKFAPILFSEEYTEATTTFVQQARRFDRDLSKEDLFQALRNVWIMCGLQMLLDLPVAVTPPVFAYSMLYPYTDNYLDHPGVTNQAKAQLMRKISSCLQGVRPIPDSPEEDRIFSLIGMIEDELPRAVFPQVWESLLAIQHGQAKSLRQHDPGIDAGQILAITMEKGGTSVLADGCLVAGTLDYEAAAFCFGYGVLLQMLDDLQDARADRLAGHATLFSTDRRRRHLGHRARRLWHFSVKVLESDQRFSGQHQSLLKELIRTSCAQLFLQAIGMNPESFGWLLRRRMNRYSPVRFSYLRRRRNLILKRFKKIGCALENRSAATMQTAA